MATIREVMSTNLVSVGPTATVSEAATMMGRNQVGSALVLEGNAIAGIFTERDIVRALAADFDAPSGPVSHWMTKEPATIDADATAEVALDMMLSGGYRHLPVVEEGELVGMVSIRDLSAATRQE